MIAGSMRIEEELESLEEGRMRVERVKNERVERCIEMFQEYREKVGCYERYKERVE